MSLLERGNTRLAPLDTVEPDCWLCGSDNVDAFIVWKKCDADTALKDGLDPSPWYAEATVERLLSQCRKDALLEAAEIVGKSYATFKATEQAHYRLSAEPFVHENFGFNISVVRYSQYANDELRRMAESSMEGEE